MGEVSKPKVLMLMGSKSDLDHLNKTKEILKSFDVIADLHISSAHRTPEDTKKRVSSAEEDGYSLIIAAAGLSAHLPGVCAAYTHLPIIGIPIDAGPLRGEDALHSIVMMPPGVPVGTMGIGSSGAKNAGIYAVQILSLKYPHLKNRVIEYKKEMTQKILAEDEALQKENS